MESFIRKVCTRDKKKVKWAGNVKTVTDLGEAGSVNFLEKFKGL